MSTIIQTPIQGFDVASIMGHFSSMNWNPWFKVTLLNAWLWEKLEMSGFLEFHAPITPTLVFYLSALSVQIAGMRGGEHALESLNLALHF